MSEEKTKFSLSAVSFVEGVLTAMVLALGGWVWNTNAQVAVMEGEVAALQLQSESVSRHEVEIEVLKTELRYIRDKEGREVDFAIVREGHLEELVEAKLSEERISKALLYYAQRLKPERATQIVAELRRPYDRNGIKVVDPVSYFTNDRV